MAAIHGNTNVVYGGQQTIAGYIVVSDEPGGANILQEDVENAAGAVQSRIVFQTQPKLNLELIAATGTFLEFTEGTMCSLTALSNYFVDSRVITKVKGAQRGRISMTALFA